MSFILAEWTCRASHTHTMGGQVEAGHLDAAAGIARFDRQARNSCRITLVTPPSAIISCTKLLLYLLGFVQDPLIILSDFPAVPWPAALQAAGVCPRRPRCPRWLVD